MSYLALYRQWRPRTLDEIVGQEHITKTLRNAVRAGKVSHAYLFCGPRGTGKTSTAKVLARSINCPHQEEGEPCNNCRFCLEAISGASMDVIEIDAASNRGIDEIRELKEKIKYYPTLGTKRVYIVDEVHMLTAEAFNALLKTLEEPPAHVVFILATTEPHKVPLTILSRCQRFDFRPIPGEVIVDRLEEVAIKSGFDIDGEAVGVISRASGGSLRDALSVLDQALMLSGGAAVTAETVHGILGTVREDVLAELAAALAEKKTADVLNLVARIAGEGKDLHLLAGGFAEYLRGLLVSMITLDSGKETSGTAGPTVRFTRGGLIRAVDLLVEAEQAMRRSTHSRVVLELALIRAARVDSTDSSGDLPERIERLEDTVRALADKERKLRYSSVSQSAMAKSVLPPVKPVAGEKNKPEVVEKPSVKGNTKDSGPAPGDLQSAVPQGDEGVGTIPAIPSQEALSGDAVTASRKPREEKHLVPAQPESKPDQAVESAPYGIEQITNLWPGIKEAVKKASPAIHAYLEQAWPAEVKDRCLIIGLEKGEDFFKQMIEDDAAKKLLVQTLRSFTSADWQIRCSYYDSPPPGWEGREEQLQCDEAMSLFNAEEISPEGGSDNSKEVK